MAFVDAMLVIMTDKEQHRANIAPSKKDRVMQLSIASLYPFVPTPTTINA